MIVLESVNATFAVCVQVLLVELLYFRHESALSEIDDLYLAAIFANHDVVILMVSMVNPCVGYGSRLAHNLCKHALHLLEVLRVVLHGFAYYVEPNVVV